MDASLGKIPTTSVRRLISPFRRSIGFVLCSFVRCCGGKGHVGEDVLLGAVHEGRELRQLRAHLVRHQPPLGFGRGVVWLSEGGSDKG